MEKRTSRQILLIACMIAVIAIPFIIFGIYRAVTGSSGIDKGGGSRGSITYQAFDGGKVMSAERGEISESIVLRKSDDAKPQNIVAIADDGYYFVEWSDGCKDIERTDEFAQNDLVFCARFAEINDPVTLTYGVVGGKLVGYNTQIVQRGTRGRNVYVFTDDENKDFLGWSDGVSEQTRQDSVTENLTVIAEFGYILDYSASEHGTIEGNTNQRVVDRDDITSVKAVPERGWTFIMWSDGVTSATRNDNDAVSSKAVVAYFAQPDTEIIMYHYGNVVNKDYKEAEFVRRDTSDNIRLYVPQDDYYDFDGWFFDEALTERATYNDGVLNSINTVLQQPSRDLYAKWVDHNIKITYCYNGATGGNNKPFDYVRSNSEQPVRLAVPERENYYFDGWFFDEELTKRATGADGLVRVIGIFDKTEYELYAKWVSEVVLIKYHYNNATGGNDKIEEYLPRNVEQPVRLAVPERDGYEFAGWTTSGENGRVVAYADGIIADMAFVMSHNELDVYAIWVEKTE